MSFKPSFTSHQLKTMTDEQLVHHWSGYKENTGDWHLAKNEMIRRQNKPSDIRGWISIFISIGALLVSIIALIY
ncbi:MAG: hypothetical protein CTY33_01190 [Methylotenera sp.]|nr:MAG: hypothetical protein CTY33_01190 [Methylotenera sp.]